MNIGFIGLGHMGQPMVNHLLQTGHHVTVFDVSADAIKACEKDGAVAAKNTAETAKNADVIMTMVQTGEQVKSICLGDDGVFANANKNSLFIDSSSIAINHSRDLHRSAAKAGLLMVDAPVSGGVAGAEAASLTIMVGGSDEAFTRAEPILKLLGKNVIHAGAAGNGQAAKICNNMILGVSMIAVCEAFVLAEKLGLDPEKLFEISSQASGQCWSMTSYCPVPGPVPAAPSNNDYQPGFTAQMMLKDLRLSQDAAANCDASTPLGAAATMQYSTFNNLGYDQMDFSGIIKMLQGKSKSG